jgi:hypothetical protein
VRTQEPADALRLTHLRRELKTAIELALAAMAPNEIVDPLATSAGLLDALLEFPRDAPPTIATLPRALSLAEGGLSAWLEWQERRGKGSA